MNVSDNTVSTPDAKIPLQPMKPTDILDAMFSLYLRHFRLFLGISAVYFVTMFSLSLLSLTGIFYTFSGTLSGTFAIMVVLFVITVPVVIAISLIGYRRAYLCKCKVLFRGADHIWHCLTARSQAVFTLPWQQFSLGTGCRGINDYNYRYTVCHLFRCALVFL